MKKYILIVLLSTFILSCNSDDDKSETTVETTLIAKDGLSGNGEEGIVEKNMIITDKSTWENLITKMNSVNIVSDDFSEVEIDFSKYTVVAVFDKIRNSGGHTTELKVTSNSENITVKVTDFAPEENDITVITQPFHIVKISNSDLPILFK